MMRFIALFFLRVKKLRLILANPELRRVFFKYLVLAGVEHKAVLSRPLSTIVDIGANRGQFALAARAISGAKVVSFEPLPDVAEIFQKIFSCDPSVKLHVAAIGENAGREIIHLSARDDSSSLLEIGEVQSIYFPGTQEVGTLEVAVGTLDDFLTKEDIVRPAMLKLDVQGFELQALTGCKSLIGNFSYVYCECSFVELYKNQKLAGEVINYLNALGFGLAGIYNPSYDRCGNCIQADLLFEQMVC
jgi:FkbM family methyltransferase